MFNTIFTVAFMVLLFTTFVYKGGVTDGGEFIVSIPAILVIIGTLLGLGTFISSLVKE